MIELEPGRPNWTSLHGQRIDLGGYNFVGYQYSLPFMGGIFERPEDEIRRDIEALEPLMDAKTVFVTHNPALGVLDLGVLGIPAGSAAILNAVERRGVRIHVHGHIHEQFGRSGRHFNVAGGGRLRGFVIDLDTLEHDPLC